VTRCRLCGDQAPPGRAPSVADLVRHMAAACALLAVALAVASASARAQAPTSGTESQAVSAESQTAAASQQLAEPQAQPPADLDPVARAEWERVQREKSVKVDMTSATPAGQEAERIAGRSPWATLLSTLFSLALVIGLIYAVYAVMRWLRREGTPRARTGQLVNVLETTKLTPDKALHVVAVGGHVVLLASGPSGVTFLADLDDEEVARIAKLPQPSSFGAEIEQAEAAYESDRSVFAQRRPSEASEAEEPPGGGASIQRALHLLRSVGKRGRRH